MLDLASVLEAFRRLRGVAESREDLREAIVPALWLEQHAEQLAEGKLRLSRPTSSMRLRRIDSRESAELLIKAIEAIPSVQGDEEQCVVVAYGSLRAAMVYLIMDPIFRSYPELIPSTEHDPEDEP